MGMGQWLLQDLVEVSYSLRKIRFYSGTIPATNERAKWQDKDRKIKKKWYQQKDQYQ